MWVVGGIQPNPLQTTYFPVRDPQGPRVGDGPTSRRGRRGPGISSESRNNYCILNRGFVSEGQNPYCWDGFSSEPRSSLVWRPYSTCFGCSPVHGSSFHWSTRTYSRCLRLRLRPPAPVAPSSVPSSTVRSGMGVGRSHWPEEGLWSKDPGKDLPTTGKRTGPRTLVYSVSKTKSTIKP